MTGRDKRQHLHRTDELHKTDAIQIQSVVTSVDVWGPKCRFSDNGPTKP